MAHTVEAPGLSRLAQLHAVLSHHPHWLCGGGGGGGGADRDKRQYQDVAERTGTPDLNWKSTSWGKSLNLLCLGVLICKTEIIDWEDEINCYVQSI